MFQKIRNKLTDWLGITALESKHDLLRKQFSNVTRIDSDVGFKGNTMIIITSTLANGRVEIIHSQFENLRKFEDYVKHLKHCFGVAPKNIHLDLPNGFDDRMFGFRD